MKLPYLRVRKYKNKAGQVWVGYYYEPPRGFGGKPGVRPTPIPLGSELLLKGQDVRAVPPAAVLAKYSEVAQVKVSRTTVEGTCQAVYERWHEWALTEVKADRLGKRTLKDYEKHWKQLSPVFGNGPIDGLTQPLMLGYFDRRTSKDQGKREINFLGLLCAWAKPRGYMDAANPVDRGLRRQLKVQKVLKPVVPPDVYRVVWYCGDQLVRDALDLAYMLATRPNEVLRVIMPPVGATHIEKIMPKTVKRGRRAVKFPITPDLAALIERRRALNPNSLYLLFDDEGRQLLEQGMIRTRLTKAIRKAKVVCTQLGIEWVPFTRQQLRPTVLTDADKVNARDAVRRLAGHTTEKQTADYIRHEAEIATPACLPSIDMDLLQRIARLTSDAAGNGPAEKPA